MLNWNDIIHFSVAGNPAPDKRIEKSEEEWKQLLTEGVFGITRLHQTERPHSSDLCSAFEPGVYACACCKEKLFDASEKFESGTGWPSFTQPIKENAISYIKDSSFGMIRVEALCNTCDSHLGHVFPDGPEPGGLRFCINALALVKD
jgi:peptide-methionine (R)-S-oxide reductase